jgi:hypothetical protein
LSTAILQLRVELLHIEPPIWRRLQIPGDYTLWDLHVAIQSAFGWNDSHLHAFTQPGHPGDGPRFGIPMEEFDDLAPTLPCWKHRVADVLSLSNPQLEYEYDFGDGWQHLITLEEIFAAAPGKKYPRCTAGERAGPPDDCGGPGGYEACSMSSPTPRIRSTIHPMCGRPARRACAAGSTPRPSTNSRSSSPIRRLA